MVGEFQAIIDNNNMIRGLRLYIIRHQYISYLKFKKIFSEIARLEKLNEKIMRCKIGEFRSEIKKFPSKINKSKVEF